MKPQYEVSAEDYSRNKEKDLLENRQEHVRDELIAFISRMCEDFGWQYDNVHSRMLVGAMIQKALE